jgi:asparagine synthase (glutamine-hydrolysing)
MTVAPLLGRRHFLAVSVAARGSVPRPAVRAIERAGMDPSVLVDGAVLIHDDGHGPTVASASVDATLGAIRDPTAAAPCGADDLETWVATTLPPAGRATWDAATDAGPRLRVATDNRAICELYECHGTGWALVSTSPLLLSAACEASVDEMAVLRYSQLGHFLGDESPWAGVRRLGPREIVELRGGDLRSSTAPAATSSVSTLADATRAVVGAVADSRPELELSGGLDSRLILAALVAGDVDVRRCLTIGAPGDQDREVAIELAEAAGFRHELVDPGSLAGQSPESLVRLATTAGADRGWVANPIDSAPLHWVEEGRGEAAGLSGQNGEIARGFYYRGPHRFVPAPRRVPSLVRWRLLSNASIDARLLDVDVRTGIEDGVVAAVRPWLDDSSVTRFLESTDEFYLRHRMTRWVGPAYGAAARRHPVIAPFFSVGFIEAARLLSISERRHSSAVASAVGELDPGLARRPLAGGPPPVRLATWPGTIGGAGLVVQARKAIRKITQRFGHVPARATGTQVVSNALAADIDPLIESLRGDPLLSPDGIELQRGAPDARDLAFLVSLAAWRHPH